MRILIADDHDMVLETIAAFIRTELNADISTVGNLNKAVECIKSRPPFDLVLLDYNMPGMNGLEGLARARAAAPDGKVAILSGTLSNRLVQESLKEGAVGFLPKTMGSKSLVNAVRFMAEGETYVPHSLLKDTQPGAGNPLAEKLTTRELDVLEKLCTGQANKEIALALGLQEVTIKLHVRSLCKKLDVKNRTQAALAAKDAWLF
ncbi:MAG: response regulator [Paracoccaceae bacterium]